MSFILDALKKSEERRRLQEEDQRPRQRIFDMTWSGRRRWPVWTSLVVLLVALACGWWLRGISQQPSKPVGSTAAAPSGQISPSVSPPPAASPEIVTGRSSARVADPAPFAPVPVDPIGAAVPPAPASPRPAAREVVMPAGRVPVPAPMPATPAARQRQTPGKVPAALRDRISRLTMSLHFYAADPAQRMVRIDNRILREGQALADDLILEEITPTGVIFSSSGERFEIIRPGE